MTRKVSVEIEQDEDGYYEGKTVEESLPNIREAIELILETLTEGERTTALSREIPTTSIEIHA